MVSTYPTSFWLFALDFSEALWKNPMTLRVQFETHSIKQVTIIYTIVYYDICKEYLEA